MKRLRTLKICILALVAGLGLGEVCAQSMSICSEAYRDTLGYSRPGNWADSHRGAISGERLLQTSPWQTARSKILSSAEDRSAAERTLARHEENVVKARAKYNKAHVKALNIKGQAVENLMDDFYTKDGWEKMDGKRGRNGFDGLYVKRNKNGAIVSWFAAEAKSGSSKLNSTKHGRQLSPEWVKHNNETLLSQAQQDYAANPTKRNARRLADLQQINKLQGRQPRLFRAEWTTKNGAPHMVISQQTATGKKVSRPMEVDMTKPSRNRQMCNKAIRGAVLEYLPNSKGKAIDAFVDALNGGKITDDASFHRVFTDISRGKMPRATRIAKLGGRALYLADKVLNPEEILLEQGQKAWQKFSPKAVKFIKARPSLRPMAKMGTNMGKSVARGMRVVKTAGRKLGTAMAKRAGAVLGKGVLKRIATSSAAGAVGGPAGVALGAAVGIIWTAWDVTSLGLDYVEMKRQEEAERVKRELDMAKRIAEIIKTDNERKQKIAELEKKIPELQGQRENLRKELKLAS